MKQKMKVANVFSSGLEADRSFCQHEWKKQENLYSICKMCVKLSVCDCESLQPVKNVYLMYIFMFDVDVYQSMVKVLFLNHHVVLYLYNHTL